MSYLRESDIIAIQDSVRLLSINEIDGISHYLFDSHIAEYNEFLKSANTFYELNISKTFKRINEYDAFSRFNKTDE